MKKKTLISKLRDNRKSELEVLNHDLELVLGGIKTITQDASGHVIVVDGDKEPV